MAPTEQTPLLTTAGEEENLTWKGRLHRWVSARRYSRRTLFIRIGAVLLASSILYLLLKHHPEPVLPPSLLVSGRRGAIAAEVDVCSSIGTRILEQGGNAVDAAIGAALCVGTINFFSSGIGGGGFMLVHAPTGEATSFNFRETAPANASKDMFTENPILAQLGALSVGVPGELAGMYEAWSRYGELDWQCIVEPSARLAAKGFRVSKVLAERLRVPYLLGLKEDPVWASVIAPEGHLLMEGETMQRPAYAETLLQIAREGVQSFYNGSLAHVMVRYLQSKGGIITKEDFANYRVEVEPALETQYRNRTVYTTQLPSGGPALIEGLNILDGFDFDTLTSHERLQVIIETMKWMFAGRSQLGDPKYIQENLEKVKELLDPEHAKAIRANISLDRTFPYEYYQPAFDVAENHGTTHVTAIDSKGFTASITSTVNLEFGSHLMDPTTGVVFNDEMDDFSIPGARNAFNVSASPWNYVAPGKRPLSSSAPTVVLDAAGERVDLALGGSGGSRILTAVLNTIINYVDLHYDLEQSITLPRAHHQLLPELVLLEPGFTKKTIDFLTGVGHDVFQLGPKPLSEIQAVNQLGSLYFGFSDPRKAGVAAAL
ncbi:gamma-glutamyltranspeptidase Ggt2 [Schizosaccharomyces japonicus yFS275]|uniref:Glutathione hydrolase n=1 Tax=Schizosaccharomyces japonicus (strain yFS275 / FY16936) TaxID=402676 RepID=B6K3X1_SCHJY|nr:gamma-glutamyltranspeptidase Ggt2 [Schizosaccharomyces japonicus yFS275]EEB08178.1 gamma-glutamyltranspeptidase Ggt2 [Schizosaccharomyces japonicus yFS275]